MTKEIDTSILANIAVAFGGLKQFLRPFVEEVVADCLARQTARGGGVLAQTFDTGDAADYIGIGRTKFVDLVKAGEIKQSKVAGMVRYYRTELDRYLRRCGEE